MIVWCHKCETEPIEVYWDGFRPVCQPCRPWVIYREGLSSHTYVEQFAPQPGPPEFFVTARPPSLRLPEMFDTLLDIWAGRGPRPDDHIIRSEN